MNSPLTDQNSYVHIRVIYVKLVPVRRVLGVRTMWISQRLPEWSFCLSLASSDRRANATSLQVRWTNSIWCVLKVYNLKCWHMCASTKPPHKVVNMPNPTNCPPDPLQSLSHPLLPIQGTTHLLSVPRGQFTFSSTVWMESYSLCWFLFGFFTSMIILSFIHVLPCINGSFLFYCWVLFHCMDVSQFVYPFTWR